MDWDIALKIWAVVGPLTAAAASAVWSRRNQIQDRAYEGEQQALSRQYAVEDKEREFKRSLLTSQKTELRLALSQFVAAANYYLEICQIHYQRGRDEKTESDQLEALAKLGGYYQIVNILGTEKLASLAKRVHNLATDYPINIVQQQEVHIEGHLQAYLQAKMELAKESRKLLGFDSEA